MSYRSVRWDIYFLSTIRILQIVREKGVQITQNVQRSFQIRVHVYIPHIISFQIRVHVYRSHIYLVTDQGARVQITQIVVHTRVISAYKLANPCARIMIMTTPCRSPLRNVYAHATQILL